MIIQPQAQPLQQLQALQQLQPMQPLQPMQQQQQQQQQRRTNGNGSNINISNNINNNNGAANPPSSVVFVGEIPSNTNELELRRVFHEFGKINAIFAMPAKHQALIEFHRITDAERLIAIHQCHPISIGSSALVISFSSRARIDLSQEPYLSQQPQTCLLLTIYNMKVEFSCDTIRHICNLYAILDRCVLIKQQDGLMRAVCEFWRLEDAVLAKVHLNGADMHIGCNSIRCDYAQPSAFEFFTSRDTIIGEYYYQPDADAAAIGFERRHPLLIGQHALLGGGAAAAAGVGIRNGDVMSLGNRGQGTALSLSNTRPSGQLAFANNIIVVRGLSAEMNCDRLFNLLVLYGNVSRVKFLTTKEGFALVEMSDSTSAQQVVQHLNGHRVLGSVLKITLSDQDNVKRNTKEFTLPDGTQAEKCYDSLKLNRFMTPETAAKNQVSLGRTGPILYFWGCPEGTNCHAVCSLLKQCGAPAPLEVSMQNEKCTTGWITFDSALEATDAICLANHVPFAELGRLKLSYAVNKKDSNLILMQH